MNKDYLILIVEDEKPISKFVKATLDTQGYNCMEAETGSSAMLLVCSMNPDVVILDLGLPDVDGMNLIEKIKELSQAKIIVVSAREHEREKVRALDLGADDYLTKPFSTPELLARIRVALRNKENYIKNEDNKKSFVLKGLKIDFEKHEVTVDDEQIHLTPIEYKILELMSKHQGKALTHRFITKEIWGGYCESEVQSLRVFMASIRRKIEKDPAQPKYIKTEVGVGYKLVSE